MSNRLVFAHTAPRREPHEWMPAPAPSKGFATSAMAWVRGLANADDMPAAMRRDLGLPYAGKSDVAFAAEVERSRLRL